MRHAVSAIGLAALVAACGTDFTPPHVIERLRILGVRVDHPEICPFGPAACSPGAFHDKVTVSVLAADPDGVVADGAYAGGPILTAGHALTWAMCTYAMNGGTETDPDCTADPASVVGGSVPDIGLPTTDIIAALLKAYRSAGVDLAGQTGMPPPTDDPFKVVEITQNLGVAIASATQREWAIKGLTLSNRTTAGLNVNPILDEITLDGVKVASGDAPFAGVETGYAYRVGWKYPDSAAQLRRVKSENGVAEKLEQLTLKFWATAGSFNKSEEVDVWMDYPPDEQLYWRPPLEVPAAGLVATLFFKLSDGRGGCDWVWGKVKVVRGEAAGPR